MLSQQSKELMLPLLLTLLSLFMQCTQKDAQPDGNSITEIQSLLKQRTVEAYEQAKANFKELPKKEVDQTVLKELEAQFAQFESDLKDFKESFGAATEAFNHQDFAEAKSKVGTALEKFPGDAEAKKLQSEIEERLASKKQRPIDPDPPTPSPSPDTWDQKRQGDFLEKN